MQRAEMNWLTLENLPAGLKAGVTTKISGASQGVYAAGNLAHHVADDPMAVAANRKALQNSLGASSVQWLQQTHSTRVIYADAASSQQTPTADAVWSDVPGLALAVLTADCVPILLWRADASAVAAVHAGWRGMIGGIIQRAVSHLETAHVPVYAWIGPCIRPTHYEVGADVWQQFASWGGGVVQSHPSEPAKRLLDLGQAAKRCLASAGVAQIEDSGLCTFCDARFYSHRGCQGHETGRFASIILIQ